MGSLHNGRSPLFLVLPFNPLPCPPSRSEKEAGELGHTSQVQNAIPREEYFKHGFIAENSKSERS